jgi:hypothetical protein
MVTAWADGDESSSSSAAITNEMTRHDDRVDLLGGKTIDQASSESQDDAYIFIQSRADRFGPVHQFFKSPDRRDIGLLAW